MHATNINGNSKVALNIFDSSQEWGSNLQGLQIFGKAKAADTKELLAGGKLYLQRFMKAKNLIQNIKDFNSKKFESKIYKIEIDSIKVFDEISFGKEVYHTIKIER